MEKFYAVANSIDLAKIENYNYFIQKEDSYVKPIDYINMLNNYFQKILNGKLKNKDIIKEKAYLLSKSFIQHLTGNYDIGLGETFEEIDENTETFSNILAYSDEELLEELLRNNRESEVAEIVVDGSISSGILECSKNEMVNKKAKENFDKKEQTIKKFFINAVDNIIHLNEKIANGIAHISGMDKEESQGLNENILGKFIGGLGYEFISGTLVSKMHFTSIQNSDSMKELINKEGILHFSSPSNIEKIMEQGKIKKSSMLISDMTLPKSFFFAGTPKFEDLLINIPAYDVMTAVRIRPTEEQMKELKYRALNDRAVVKDGDFEFSNEQAEIAYFGLMYDKEKDNIYLGELTKEEAEKFQVSEEVKNAYHYKTGRNSIIDNIKMNAYGLYAEYRHHQKLLQMERKLKERGIKDFKNVNDEVLVELADIKDAYISTRGKSVERKTIIDRIKQRIQTKNIDKNNFIGEKEETEDERNI